MAESAGRIVGTIGLIGFGEREGALRKMFVAAEARGAGQGVGARLLAMLIDHAQGQGIKAITLGTVEKLHAARAVLREERLCRGPAWKTCQPVFRACQWTHHFYRLEL